jgi:pimeloyl-ACP methyl ester carboxylesterase
MSTLLNTSIKPQFHTVDGLKIRFAESEERSEHALLFCPWPESLYAFDQMWSRLAEHVHLVAVDLPGFGHSERRNSLMGPRAMGEFVIRLADHFGLEHPHAVGPDVGTDALLFAADDNPGRLRSLVVGTAAVSFPIDLGSPLSDWVTAPDVERYRAIDPRTIVSTAMSTIQGYKLPDLVREDYLSAYEGDRFVESMRYVRAYPDELPILAELLPQIETPVQIIGGLRDRVVPPSNHYYLHERLPKSKLDLIDSGHFIWEEAPEEYAAIVSQWWGGGYANIGAAAAQEGERAPQQSMGTR